MEGSVHIEDSFGAGEADLRAGVACSRQGGLVEGDFKLFAQDLSEKGGLVVAALAEPAAMEGHGHHQVGRQALGSPSLFHGVSEHGGQATDLVVFQLQDCISYDAFHQEGRGDSIEAQG